MKLCPAKAMSPHWTSALILTPAFVLVNMQEQA